MPLSNRDIGFLPGDIHSKINPFMQPLWDNLGIIKNQFDEKEREYKKVDELVETEKLHIVPLAYIRGRSLSNVIFIVDEAQNLTPHEVKTIITRAGERTKIILTGDIFQIDTPYLDAQQQRPLLPDRPHPGEPALRPRQSGEGGAVGAGEPGEHDAVGALTPVLGRRKKTCAQSAPTRWARFRSPPRRGTSAAKPAERPARPARTRWVAALRMRSMASSTESVNRSRSQSAGRIVFSGTMR